MQPKMKINWMVILVFILFLAFVGFLIWYFLKGNVVKLTENQLLTLFQAGELNSLKGIIISNGFSVAFDPSTVHLDGYLKTDDGKIIHYAATLYTGFWESKIMPLFESGSGSKVIGINYWVSDNQAVSIWKNLLVNLLPVLILIFGSFWLLSRLSKSSAGGMNPFSMGKNRARTQKSETKFSDVAGIKEEKLELEEIVDYLKFPQRYSQMGARTPKGVLLVGPPGTGKTLLAKAVAGEAGVPFFSISGAEFEEVFVGVGASRVREMFTAAKKSAPCIIFIDEIDAVGRKRASAATTANEQTLNQLLVEMDGFETNVGIIIMAATNRRDVLDEALLRPGRFDREISLSLPDIKEREAILRLHARNKNISPKVNFERIAERTPGFSGAQLENVLNEATLLAVRHHKNVIGLVEIDEAIDRVVGGPAKTSRVITKNDKKIVSYHEAGHALIGLRLEYASKVQKVTIIPRGQAGGYTIMTPKEETMFYSKTHLIATVTGYLGGRASEEIIFGKPNVTTGAHDDLQKATTIARRMITEYGMSDNLGLAQFENPAESGNPFAQSTISNNIANKIDDEVKQMLDQCYQEAIKLIKANRKTLDLIATSLMTLETITAEQIEYINEHDKLPQEVLERQKDFKKGESKKNSSDDTDESAHDGSEHESDETISVTPKKK
ncbi:ATP-dependent zinc metalloprotease FtsH [Spiroplasma sp. JKS002669]|uniref:ATP-dependent zinc metalloprotease FtsH n=1 Tax=Spiroplasma attinicola TaxID=2904537 RepID=UPI0020BDA6AD|nr:ATP-dependent zinc metalloprotease FtsH [Spiroplasma sp. JKS002669]MCL6428840.1 ATP-dependent zinc metalloprotease FtsH [Spiroplasma sp. JKS002669]